MRTVCHFIVLGLILLHLYFTYKACVVPPKTERLPVVTVDWSQAQEITPAEFEQLHLR